MVFWLFLLGIITYLILRRSVTRITRTPVWLLWLVMMAPAFIWTGWVLLNGNKEPPALIVILPFLICPILYWALIQWGRVNFTPPPPNSNPENLEKSLIDPVKLPEANLRPIDQNEEAILRNCFPWTVYFLQNLEYLPQAVICRGQLRTNSETAYQKIRENIEAKFGDRFLVLLQNTLNDKPFFALVSNPQKRQNPPGVKIEPINRPLLALALLATSLLTTTIAGARLIGIPSQSIQNNPALIWQGLPYALVLILTIGMHELGHYLTARYYKIKVTLPYFVPIPFFIGTLGAYVQTHSPIPNRKTTFDINLAGPIAGLIIAIPLLIWGLSHSQVVPLTAQSGMLNFNSMAPNSSLLLALLSKLSLGKSLTENSAINLHPLGIASYLGLMITAFNLIPVGQLDGGRIVHAMFGQKNSMMIAQVARMLLLFRSLISQELLIFSLLSFLIPITSEPALNDVSELDDKRDFLGLVALGFLLLIILPVPKMFNNLLF